MKQRLGYLFRGFLISLAMSLIAYPIAYTCVGIWGRARGLIVSYAITLTLGTLLNAAVNSFRRRECVLCSRCGSALSEPIISTPTERAA